MYKPSKIYASFFIAGFQYHDGVFALGKLKPGKKLKMVAEPDNPYDPNAVALRYKGTMLGYVPLSENGPLAHMMYFGHKDVYEARVMQVNTEADPWEQVRVGIVSGNKEPGKVAKAGWTAVPGEEVYAPVFQELPVTMECKVVSISEELGETRVVGEVVNTQVSEAFLSEDGKVDVSGMGVITFLASDLGYYELGAKAGQAFKDGAARLASGST